MLSWRATLGSIVVVVVIVVQLQNIPYKTIQMSLLLLHVNCLICLCDFKQIWIFSTDFNELSYIKLDRNPSRGSRICTCGQTEVTKLIGAFRNLWGRA